ncbi:1,4-dihydroxy-2-naphthoate polyprenyltransferase [Microcella sp.]|uniref:1,4-dihydroxy-2-naphthoate polyprenyltransferase n=1 Tax=Microcella sp. TaxID=1913979 RepID=UPI00299F6CD1|nr:1,4-dihydroxy-2-naphthoate polyprenyltransferase [Microcella sp.]MDX2026207.1 1,4-dihydroxy-2-naphthoate polyprenyltransferase [Microcella sp.]
MATTKKARAKKPASKQTKRTNPAKASAASGNPAKVRRATARDWIAGARLRTLSLAISPVALGTAIAYVTQGYNLALALLCLGVAVFLQIGVNFANDYSDGVRGTDAQRVGPSRLTGSGAARPRTVLTVALVFFGLGAAAGIAIVVLTGIWWLLAVGAVAIVAAWFYTGGKLPYGYLGLGELVAFLFFGLVATMGTTFVQIQQVPFEAWLAGSLAGLFAAAIMLVNNIRDREQDARVGKKTLAVRIGDLPARILFVLMLLGAFGFIVPFALIYVWAPMVFFTLLISAPVVLIVLLAKTPHELVLALKLTSLAALTTGLGLAAAIAF